LAWLGIQLLEFFDRFDESTANHRTHALIHIYSRLKYGTSHVLGNERSQLVLLSMVGEDRTDAATKL
jgi:hypothetical protein